MPDTLTYSGQLEIFSCWCGIRYAIPAELARIHRNDKEHRLFCPLGHSGVIAGKTTAQKLEDERERARALELSLRDQLAAEQRSKAAIRGHLTRARRRGGAGMCPVEGCRRHFGNVDAHLKRMHPGFVESLTT